MLEMMMGGGVGRVREGACGEILPTHVRMSACGSQRAPAGCMQQAPTRQQGERAEKLQRVHQVVLIVVIRPEHQVRVPVERTLGDSQVLHESRFENLLELIDG